MKFHLKWKLLKFQIFQKFSGRNGRRRGGGRVDPGGDNNFIKKRLQIVSWSRMLECYAGLGPAERAVFQQWKESPCSQCLLEVFTHLLQKIWLLPHFALPMIWHLSIVFKDNSANDDSWQYDHDHVFVRSDPLEACLQRSCLENTVHIYNHKVLLLRTMNERKDEIVDLEEQRTCWSENALKVEVEGKPVTNQKSSGRWEPLSCIFFDV